jgi:hypothetical protein
MTTRIMVAAVFLAGCAVGGVSSQLAVPLATAQQTATPLTRWEYRCITDGWEEVRSGMNGAGAQGWELVSHTYGPTLAPTTACFKRPKT